MRSVSQIYSEAVTTRNNYLQLTELNTGRSNSKLSMINLLTYVMAVCIHTYEAILDVFEVKVAKVLTGRINGTPDWYALMAKKFQYNPVTDMGDELQFNEETMKIEYVTQDSSHRIIEKAAWQTGEDGNSITLKVCKSNTNTNEVNSGIPYTQLSDYEMTAFKMFIQQIKFVGAEIYCESVPGDIITIIADKDNPIYYNDSYVTAAQAMDEIQQAMINFANEMEYNGMLYYQSILDILRKIEHIVDIGNSVRVYVASYNATDKCYDEPVELTSRIRLKSGYIRLLDTNAAMTINSTNLTLVASSKMDEYLKSLEEESEGNNESE